MEGPGDPAGVRLGDVVDAGGVAGRELALRHQVRLLADAGGGDGDAHAAVALLQALDDFRHLLPFLQAVDLRFSLSEGQLDVSFGDQVDGPDAAALVAAGAPDAVDDETAAAGDRRGVARGVLEGQRAHRRDEAGLEAVREGHERQSQRLQMVLAELFGQRHRMAGGRFLQLFLAGHRLAEADAAGQASPLGFGDVDDGNAPELLHGLDAADAELFPDPEVVHPRQVPGGADAQLLQPWAVSPAYAPDVADFRVLEHVLLQFLRDEDRGVLRVLVQVFAGLGQRAGPPDADGHRHAGVAHHLLVQVLAPGLAGFSDREERFVD